MTTKTTAAQLDAQLATAEQGAANARDAITTRKAALEAERDTRRGQWAIKRAKHLTTQRTTDADTVDNAPARLSEALTAGDPFGPILVAATTARQRLRATSIEAADYGIPAPTMSGTAANGKAEDYTLELLLKAITTAADATVSTETQQAITDRDTFILDTGRLPAFTPPTHVEAMAAERLASAEAGRAAEAASAERARPAVESDDSKRRRAYFKV